VAGRVGAKQVEVELERGGKAVSAKLSVGDLHAITPALMRSLASGGNAMSYQQAGHFNVPTRACTSPNPGYVFGGGGHSPAAR